jgi:TRAP-type transport system small permease protein
MERIIRMYERNLLHWGIWIISTPLFIMTIVEFVNCIGRKLFIPLPASIEAVENLLGITVYFGVSIVAVKQGHVRVDMLVAHFASWVQDLLRLLGSLLGAATFGFLGSGAWIEAMRSTDMFEMRVGVYPFPVWPFKILFAVGMTFFVLQLFFDVIKAVHHALGNTSYAGMDKIEKFEVDL